MKIQTLLIGICALLVASASAIASAYITFPHYVEIRYCGSANFVCSTTNVCDDVGTVPCIIKVNGLPASVYDTKISATTCADLVTTSVIAPNISKPGQVCETILEIPSRRTN